MVEVPETRYARNGDVSLAYHVFGEGPVLVAIPPFAQNIEMAWEDSRCPKSVPKPLDNDDACRPDHRSASMRSRIAGTLPKMTTPLMNNTVPIVAGTTHAPTS